MNIVTSRKIAILVVAAVSLTTLYAHHGSQFLSKALETNAAEVQLSQVAVNKSQNARVKDFAQTLVRDHSEAIGKIKSLRDARIAFSVSTKNRVNASEASVVNADVQLTAEHRHMLDQLGTLSGMDFDREFVDIMIREHRGAIRDFEAQSHTHGNNATSSNSKKTGADAIAQQKPSNADQTDYSIDDLRHDVDTADFAQAMLPALRHHLEEAEAIQMELLKK